MNNFPSKCCPVQSWKCVGKLLSIQLMNVNEHFLMCTVLFKAGRLLGEWFSIQAMNVFLPQSGLLDEANSGDHHLALNSALQGENGQCLTIVSVWSPVHECLILLL